MLAPAGDACDEDAEAAWEDDDAEEAWEEEEAEEAEVVEEPTLVIEGADVDD